MAMIKVEEVWISEFQACAAMDFKGDDGEMMHIPEVLKHSSLCCRGIILDNSQRVFEFELPSEFTEKEIRVGSTLHITCSKLRTLDAPFKAKHVHRIIAPAKAG